MHNLLLEYTSSRKRRTQQTLINSLCFQGMWFITIYTASQKHDTLATIPSLILSIYYLLQDHPTCMRKERLLWAVIGLSLGVISELFFCYLQLFTPVSEPLFLIPFWLLGLWVALFTLMPLELKTLLQRPWLAALLGFISAPFSYISGAKMGAMVMNKTILSTSIPIALLWSIALYLATIIYRKLNLNH